MENVYDAHVHYTFDIPLKETVEIFKEEQNAKARQHRTDDNQLFNHTALGKTGQQNTASV